jgi:hypothetical protein
MGGMGSPRHVARSSPTSNPLPARPRLLLGLRRADQRRKERARDTLLASGDLLRRARDDDFAAEGTRVGTELDHVVRVLDHIQVVFDHDHGVLLVDESVQYFDETRDVLDVQTRRRLVEHVDVVTPRRARQLRDQLDPLGLAARERVARLPEAKVTQPHVNHRLQRSSNPRMVAEEVERHAYLHLEHIGHVLAAQLDTQRLRVVALASAHVASHPHVGEEVHLHADLALALACFATSTPHVEREPPRPEPLDLRHGQLGEQLSNRREQAGVRRRVARRRRPDGTLIHDDRLCILESLRQHRPLWVRGPSPVSGLSPSYPNPISTPDPTSPGSLTWPDSIERVLGAMGLSFDVPELAPARAPPGGGEQEWFGV